MLQEFPGDILHASIRWRRITLKSRPRTRFVFAVPPRPKPPGDRQSRQLAARGSGWIRSKPELSGHGFPDEVCRPRPRRRRCWSTRNGAQRSRIFGNRQETGGSRADARRSHSIRFADSEWKLIEKAAARQGIPAGEFARSGALALAEDRLGEPAPATLSAGHAALIEEIYRFACAMATLRRNELLDARRDDDLVDLVEQAREAMKGTMEEGSA